MLRCKLGTYLARKRRGRLNLPDGFPKTIYTLASLSFGQISRWAYYYNGSMSARGLVKPVTADYLHRVAPGQVWTRVTASVHEGQSEVVARLPRKCEPRVIGAAWPSTPDLFEIVEMTRRGISMPGRDNTPITVKDCINRKAVSDDIRLATRIVRQQIVGVRRNMKVPWKFLGYFRTCHDFLILTGRFRIPAGLVRFLIGLWVKAPTSLWLVNNCSFKCYLRRTRATDLISSPVTRGPPLRSSSPAPSTSTASTESGRVSSPQHVRDPELLWSLYVPRMHLYQEVSLLDEIDRQGCFPSRSKTKKGPPFVVR